MSDEPTTEEVEEMVEEEGELEEVVESNDPEPGSADVDIKED